MFTYSARRQVRITNAATGNWLAPLVHDPFWVWVYKSTLKLTQSTRFCDLYFLCKTKQKKRERKQTRVLFQKWLTLLIIYWYLCSFLVLSAKLVGAGCYWKSPKLLVSLCGSDIYNYVTQWWETYIYSAYITVSALVKHAGKYTFIKAYVLYMCMILGNM